MAKQKKRSRKERKTLSREIGLEIGSICGRYFLKLKYLHYGYWADDIEVDIVNVHIAQERYADFLVSHIPDGAKRILDVGCGAGQMADKLIGMGYEVDCVSPGHLFAEQARKLLPDKTHIFECFYEQLQTENRYDVILFSESFQYIDIEEGRKKTLSFLNPGGCMLICDYFKKKSLQHSPISGGHPLERFRSIISEYPFELIEDIDITDKTSPTIDIENDVFRKAVHPSIVLAQELMDNRYPLISGFFKVALQKEDKQI